MQEQAVKEFEDFKKISKRMTLRQMSKLRMIEYFPNETAWIGDEEYINCQNLLRSWHVEMRNHDSKVTINDLKFAEMTFYSWLYSKIYEKPLVIPAAPGFGKSTMLSVFLRYMVRKDKAFGAIVVKEKIEDLKELRDYINIDKGDNEYTYKSNNYAFMIRGFDDNIMTRSEYSAQFKTQKRYPILLITQKMLELQTLRGNLNRYNTFSREEGVNNDYPRRLLLIDEKPSLTVTKSLKTSQLNSLVDEIRAVSIKASGKVQSYIRKTLFFINKLRMSMENPPDEKTYKMYPIEIGYKLPQKLVRDINKCGKTETLNKAKAFESAVATGGIFNIAQNGEVTLITTQKLYYRYTIFSTFILDGTAENDPEYLTDDFFKVSPLKEPDYSNVTLHVCDKYSLSKTALASTPDVIDRVSSMVKSIVKENSTKTLVAIYKEYEDLLGEKLQEEIEKEKVLLKHFDGGRGSNKYKDADVGIFIGVIFKGDLYYPSVAQRVIGDELNTELDVDFKPTKKGLEFKDKLVEDFRISDQAVGMIQEINRLRAARKTQPVKIYLFSPNDELIKQIMQAMPGCKKESFYPLEKLTGKEDNASKLIEFFKEMPKSTPFKKSEIYKTLDIHRNTFSKLLENDRVKKAMETLNIEYATKTKLIKTKANGN